MARRKTSASSHESNEDAPARGRDLFLIDGNNLAYRAFFALPDSLGTTGGQPTNALLGFANTLLKLLVDYRPKNVVVAWDTRPTARLQDHAEYKSDRKPMPEEMKTCIPYLHEQIDLIRPKVLVALGGTAMEGLLDKTGITKLRGNWHSYRSIPLMPTYHPSYLLRNQALHEKRRVWEDMLQVMEKLGLPISEKQRNYFLKG